MGSLAIWDNDLAMNLVTCVRQNFWIPSGKMNEALEQLVHWASCHLAAGRREIDGVEKTSALMQAKNLDEALDVLGWTAHHDDDFCITELSQHRENLAGPEHFVAMSRLWMVVLKGSWLIFMNKDDLQFFRWSYIQSKAGIMLERGGKIVFS